MTYEEAARQNPDSLCPPEILARQVLFTVRFYSFGGDMREGQIFIDRDLKKDIEDLFALILKEKFPIGSAVPIAHPLFHWDEELSMQANNTNAFNYRHIAGTTTLSNHALGRAIDINPLLNPFIKGDDVQPGGAVYDPGRPGTITHDSFIVTFLKERGWDWGGDWQDRKDYQHFAKP